MADALFDEWHDELELYTSQSLRRSSQGQLNTTQKQYKKLLSLMQQAEKSTEPVLNTLRDNTLFLKHNLNARAIASLKGELRTIDTDVAVLIDKMQAVN